MYFTVDITVSVETRTVSTVASTGPGQTHGPMFLVN